MAYVSPTPRAAGSIITAAIWNQDVVDNIIAIRAGAMGMTSQAALDWFYAQSATMLNLLSASGGAGKFLYFDGSNWSLQNAGLKARPVGSIFISVVSTNPNTLFGFGSWSQIAPGRTLVGLDSGDSDFNTVRKTGGAKTHTLVSGELATHTHTQNSHNHTQDSHNHTQVSHDHTNSDPATHLHSISLSTGSGTSNAKAREGDASASLGVTTTSTNVGSSLVIDSTTATNQATTATNQSTTATNQNTGGGLSHNNVQPAYTVYIWERTA